MPLESNQDTGQFDLKTFEVAVPVERTDGLRPGDIRENMTMNNTVITVYSA